MTSSAIQNLKPPELPQGYSTEKSKNPGDFNGTLPDFEKLMESSNLEAQKQLEAEKAASKGDFVLGENKNDKDFREMMEKVTGRKQDRLKNKLNKDDYLNLMITQMKYQDPTKPMENQEMAAQLAQFNSVEQLLEINKNIAKLSQAQTMQNVDKLTAFLGKTVEVGTNGLEIREGRVLKNPSFEISAPASAVMAEVRDDKGQVVRTLALGAASQGRNPVVWDGKDNSGKAVPAGHYTVDIKATSREGKPLPARLVAEAKVTGIGELGSGGKLLTDVGGVEMKDIISMKLTDEGTSKSGKQVTENASAVAPAFPEAANTKRNPQVSQDEARSKREPKEPPERGRHSREV